MSEKPANIVIDPSDADAIRKLDTLRAANASFVQSMRQAGERRHQELMEQGREVWTRIGLKYGLDLNHVQYDLTTEGDALRVVAANYAG